MSKVFCFFDGGEGKETLQFVEYSPFKDCF